jgi:diphthamide biosynthesis protein 7
LIFLGTYKLEDDKSRHGSVDIYSIIDDQLTLTHSYPTESAILDLKFSPFDDSIIYTAHSTGDLRIWRFDQGELVLLHHAQLFDTKELITSVIPSQVIPSRLLLTTTEGYAALVDVTSDRCSEPRYFTSQHELQAWTGAFGNAAELSNVVFTGGDDSSLMAHDVREPDNMAVFEVKRIHDAGITAIQTAQPGDHHGRGDWLMNKPYTIWTGSYDDCLRTLDLRCLPEIGLIQGIPPRVKEKVNLGGGVWRFVPNPRSCDNRLLTCCMYDGARIIGAKNDTEPIVERFYKDQHKSMVYGCDWSPEGSKVATCSFYDCVVHVWSPDQMVDP